MKSRIESKLFNLKGVQINPTHFLGDSRFNITAQDYSIRGVLKNNLETYPSSTDLTFNAEYTNFAIALQMQNKDVALIGFNLIEEESSIDCLQIQGRKGAYKELSPISWDRALLFATIEFARQTQISRIKLIPHYLVEGIENSNPERIIKRYDQNAKANNFIYDKATHRYVLNLQ